MNTVVILGASDKAERYSNRAQKLLMEQGFSVVPVHPTLETVEGVPIVHILADVPRHPDVLTVYVNPEHSAALVDDIRAVAPKTVIFNPGTEHPGLESDLTASGIRVIRACTVTLLVTGQFKSIIIS